MSDGRQVAAGGWRVIPASVTGPGHGRLGLVNQDRCEHQPLGGGGHLFAVADGAGSRSRSQHGADLAVQAACAAAEQCFASGGPPPDPDLWTRAAHEFGQECLRIFDRILDHQVAELYPAGAATAHADPTPYGPGTEGGRADFATTLLAVAAFPPWYVYFGVGDGFLVVDRQPGGAWLAVPPPQGREHEGATVFLTSRHRDSNLVRGVLCDPRIRGLAVCTDGVLDGMLKERQASDGTWSLSAPAAFAQYFDYFRSPRSRREDLLERLASDDFASTSGDDKTMVLAVYEP